MFYDVRVAREPAIYVHTIVVCLGACENKKEYRRRKGEGAGETYKKQRHDDNELEREIGRDSNFPKTE